MINSININKIGSIDKVNTQTGQGGGSSGGFYDCPNPKQEPDDDCKSCKCRHSCDTYKKKNGAKEDNKGTVIDYYA